MVYEDVNRRREVFVRDRKELSGRIRPEKFPKWLSDHHIFKKTKTMYLLTSAVNNAMQRP